MARLQQEAVRVALIERLRQWLAVEPIDLRWMDETGDEGDPRSRRRWIERGKKGRVTKNGEHLRRHSIGTVCPRTGQFDALILSHSGSVGFQVFADNANADARLERPRNLLSIRPWRLKGAWGMGWIKERSSKRAHFMDSRAR